MKENKKIIFSNKDKKSHISDSSNSYNKLNPFEQNFVNSLAEDYVFGDWIDESCGNFVGWTKDFNTCSISIHRENTVTGGFYHFAKMNKGYRADHDYKNNLIEEIESLSLFKISQMLSIYKHQW